jgi:hypothetical protein
MRTDNMHLAVILDKADAVHVRSKIENIGSVATSWPTIRDVAQVTDPHFELRESAETIRGNGIDSTDASATSLPPVSHKSAADKTNPTVTTMSSSEFFLLITILNSE